MIAKAQVMYKLARHGSLDTGLVPLRIWKPESVYLRPKYSANCPFLNNFSFKMTRACMIRKIIFQILPDAMREYFGETWLVANHFRVFCLMGAQHNQTRIRKCSQSSQFKWHNIGWTKGVCLTSNKRNVVSLNIFICTAIAIWRGVVRWVLQFACLGFE